ncbi:hypothetical protein U8335_03910 [Roseiconus lacunae]|uniref:hypothetical protein n=1 Tax=Roseiconus lacunae TaxID=2605694 RepID=UPI0030866F90|nr:hypothetical protein U8335_03910 [Stieleria sp. HD01]
MHDAPGVDVIAIGRFAPPEEINRMMAWKISLTTERGGRPRVIASLTEAERLVPSIAGTNNTKPQRMLF